jgi:WD40 repeat protein
MRSNFGYNSDPVFVTVDDQKSLPMDTVSSMKFTKDSDLIFACTSWDGSVRVFEIINNGGQPRMKMQYMKQFDIAITACDWNENASCLFLGTLDGRVIALDIASGQEVAVVSHNFSIRDIFYVADGQFIISFDGDRGIKVSAMGKGEVAAFALDYTIICVDFKSPRFIVGLASNKLLVFDIKDLEKNSFAYMDSPLGTPINSLELHRGLNEAILGSADGRISRITITSSYYGGKLDCKSEIIFKGHRENHPTNHSSGILYPINSMCYCYKDSKSCVVSSGSNGKAVMWEIIKKGRCKELDFKHPISYARYCQSLEMIICAVGYDWSQGVWGIERVNYPPNLLAYQYRQEDFRVEP